jgi:hypothetical protein
MTVKKKVSRGSENPGRIELSSHLARVREAIRQLPEESVMENTEANSETAAASTVKKKPTVKKVAKKPAAKPQSNGADGTTLAMICKKVKGMEPRRARRILRDADGVPDAGARWTWTKAADVAKVEKILRNADAE